MIKIQYLDDCDDQFRHQLIILLTGLARKNVKFDRDNKQLVKKVDQLKQRLVKINAPTQFNLEEELQKLQKQFKKNKQFKDNVKQMFLPEIRQEENAYRLSLKRDSQRTERLSIATHIRGVSKRQYSDFQTEVCVVYMVTKVSHLRMHA